jgi:hypothetical protein
MQGTLLDFFHKEQFSSGFGGSCAKRLWLANMDPGILRPWFSRRTGRSYVTLVDGFDDNGDQKFKNVLVNTPATLTKEAWLQMDDTILEAAKPELRLVGDLIGAGLVYNVPNGMGVTAIQHQTMLESGEATISMDALRKSNRDRPTFDTVVIPLPIIHGEWGFSLRDIEVSRNSGAPLDTTQGETITRECAEIAENLTLGTLASYSYAGGTVYGLTNFPQRLTTVLTAPTDAGWTPKTFINELLAMIQALHNIFYKGPYGVYVSPGYMQYLDNDYSQAYDGDTLRTRALKTEGVRWIRQLDGLTNFQVVVVQLTSNVIQIVTGMPFQTVSWDEDGGLALNYKTLGIIIPRIRSDANGNTGINHGTAA